MLITQITNVQLIHAGLDITITILNNFLQFAIKKRLKTVYWWNMNVQFWLYLSDDLVTPPEETDS